MKKSLLEIYALIFCLISSVWSLICTGIIIYGFIRILQPELTLNEYKYDKYQSNTEYIENCCYPEEKKEAIKKLSEDEITKKRLEEFAIELKNEQRGAKKNIIEQLIYLIINLLAFTVHWGIAKKARENQALL